MPTVLDSFVLEFSLDPSQFTRGQRQVLNDVKKLEEQALKSANQAESSTKKLSELFTAMKREALGFLGVAVGGYEARKFVDFLTNLDASTARLSRTLGINISELSAWQNAAKQFGGTGQEVTSTIMRLQQEVWNFRFGAGSNLPGALRALGGIDVFDANRNPKSGIQLLRDMADAVERLNMPTAGKAAYLRMLGIDETTINMVIQGRQALEQTLETMRKGGVATEQSGKAAIEYQQALGKLDTAATSLGRSLFMWVVNPLTWIVQKMERIIELINNLRNWESGGGGIGGGASLQRAGGSNIFTDLLLSFFPTSNQSTKDKLAAAMTGWSAGAAIPGGVSGPGGGNWTNFLSGLSFLESSQTGASNDSSTAKGFFQFIAGTAARAGAAGISDPRFGSYQRQSESTRQYIQKFYPQAASAIDRGDFKSAIAMLNQEWPSLPGGSQPQSASRYQTFAAELAGGGPRPPMTVNVQSMTVNSRADDAAGIARDIKAELTRTNFTSQVPQGSQ